MPVLVSTSDRQASGALSSPEQQTRLPAEGVSMTTQLPHHLLALPCWSGPITAEPLPGGLSNESWKVTDAAGTHVARFGRDFPVHHVERAREAMTARAAHAAGFAPAVEFTAPGVMVTAFIAARTWQAADVRANPRRVAELLLRFGTEPQKAAWLPKVVEGSVLCGAAFTESGNFIRRSKQEFAAAPHVTSHADEP